MTKTAENVSASCHDVDMAQLNQSILQAAVEGLEAKRAKLDEHIASVRAMLGNRGPRPQAQAATAQQTPQPRNHRRMSAAARKRIGEAQRKRWAAVRAAKKK